MDLNDDLDERKDSFIENDDHEVKRPLNMTVPERIVLSAGYDGDDNEDEEIQDPDNYFFGDQPLQPPDVLMVGMHTPPSTLTIDDSSATYARPSRAQGGDGSASSHPQYQTIDMLKKQYQDDSDDESRLSSADRLSKERERMELVGREDELYVVNREMSFTQLQRRVRMLENELVDTQRSQSLWKMFLLALTFINPFLISYFMRRR